MSLFTKIFPDAPPVNNWREFLSLIGDRGIVKNIPFLFYCVGLGLIYITLIHKSENRMRRINTNSRIIKELTWEYKDERSKLMFLTKESELIKKASPLGLNVNLITPKKIVVKNTSK